MSTLHTNTVETSSAGPVTLTKQAAAKLFVNFNGTGTIAIRDSLNISSLTDNSTGDYRLNYATNFSNINYVLSHSQKNETTTRVIAGAGGSQQTDPTTSNSEIGCYSESVVAYINTQFVFATGHGDLA